MGGRTAHDETHIKGTEGVAGLFSRLHPDRIAGSAVGSGTMVGHRQRTCTVHASFLVLCPDRLSGHRSAACELRLDNRWPWKTAVNCDDIHHGGLIGQLAGA